MADEQTQTQGPPPIQPPPGQVPPISPPPPPGSPESQARTWNMLCHLSALAGFVFPFAGNILGPFIVWQIKKNEIPSVDVHGKASLNFQITVTLAALVTSGAAFVGSFFCIGYLLIPVVMAIVVAGLVFTIIAGIKANNGEDFKYPVSLDLVK